MTVWHKVGQVTKSTIPHVKSHVGDDRMHYLTLYDRMHYKLFTFTMHGILSSALLLVATGVVAPLVLKGQIFDSTNA